MDLRVRTGGLLVVLALDVAGQARAQSFKITMASRRIPLALMVLLASGSLGDRCGDAKDATAAQADGGSAGGAGVAGEARGGRDGGTRTGTDAPCTMPSAPAGCVRIGGGARPYYYEGWFCPISACASGFCAGRSLGGSGRCGATRAEIRDIVDSGEGQVLEGTLP